MMRGEENTDRILIRGKREIGYEDGDGWRETNKTLLVRVWRVEVVEGDV